MPALPTECVEEIVKYFSIENDDSSNINYNSLFSCLLVNRQWCKITVPILWKKPKLTSKIVIEKCLLELNDEEELQSMLKYTTYLHSIFNYTTYIEEVCNLDLRTGIENFLNQTFLKENISNLIEEDSLIKMVLKMVLQK
ncbi:17952_t:CDS:1, partial [Gigaspora rosea]